MDKQERWTSTKIKFLSIDAKAKDALVAEMRRTFVTTKTESVALCIKVNTICAYLATKRDAAEWLRVNSTRHASDAVRLAELALERSNVADHKKEVFTLVRKLKDTCRRYKDDCNNLLTNIDNTNRNAKKLVDVM